MLNELLKLKKLKDEQSLNNENKIVNDLIESNPETTPSDEEVRFKLLKMFLQNKQNG